MGRAMPADRSSRFQKDAGKLLEDERAARQKTRGPSDTEGRHQQDQCDCLGTDSAGTFCGAPLFPDPENKIEPKQCFHVLNKTIPGF